jgi:serralysin
MPALATYSLTGDRYIDGLLGEMKWAVTSFTYSAPASGSLYESKYGSGEPDDNFATLNVAQRLVVEATLAMYASYSGLDFAEITESKSVSADLRFAMSDTPSTAWAYFPSTSPEGGDAWFNNSGGWYDSPTKGNYANTTFLHETGHALGLEHPHTDNVMPLDRDSLEYTVMSYRSYVGKSLNGGYTNETWGYPQSLMMYDIAAIQHLYGPDYGTNGGDTTYSWSPATGEMFVDGVGQGAPGANRIFQTVWDGGGADTYDFSNYETDLSVDLRPGQWTTTSSDQLAKLHYDGSQIATGNIANALLYNGDARSLIENAKGGSGNDVIIGNSAANTLWGGAGNDELRGGPGPDELRGGPGHDTLFGGAGNDILFGGAGNDRLLGGHGNDRLLGGDGDDRLFGHAGNDRLFGHGGDDRLFGGPGDDRLFGGAGNDHLYGGPGSDLLVGGKGQDTFVFRSVNDSVPGAMDTIEDFVSGVDKIHLRNIDADINSDGNQAFSFIDADAFSHTAGELNFRDQLLSGDTNGDGTADLQIYLAGVSMLYESDFIL